ncbi:MAG: PHP domain-containing protein [Clostridia bacterium]|nr:PHP domain-containing protein [Clostridia bacterium]
MNKLADMHTHSRYSHDSVCEIEDMLLAQREKGAAVFAVTDHFDCHSFERYDIYTPIQNAEQTVRQLNEKYGENPLTLAGIEIGEASFYPEVYAKMRNLANYDVIIGSVHLVRNEVVARTDFSVFSADAVTEYMNEYFDDLFVMADTIDIDVVAHLTFPLKYINGKYNIGFDIGLCKGKIEKVLSKIIEKGIALEVNTSSYSVLGDFMPPKDILKTYYDMGGHLITLGSDAHVAEKASNHFDKAVEVIKEIGFKNVYYYRSRKPYPIII